VVIVEQLSTWVTGLLELKLFILLVIANGAPIVARKLLGSISACPLDAGRRLPDGQPLFGDSKTARGIIAALLATVAAGLLLGMSIHIGLTIGAFAMLGDLLSSFIKRRLHKPSGTRFIGLDQVPESLLPLLMLQSQLDLTYTSITLLVIAFVVFDLVMSRILYRLQIRRNPH
jgi:CDP-2,3-bis-(O-geranylgeranyl)-sn-glycerol synthase